MKPEVNTNFFYRGNDILKIWEKYFQNLANHKIKFYINRPSSSLFSNHNQLTPLAESAIILEENGELYKINNQSVIISGEVENNSQLIKMALHEIFKQITNFSNHHEETCANYNIIFPYHITSSHWTLASMRLQNCSLEKDILKIEKIEINIYDSLYKSDNSNLILLNTVKELYPLAEINYSFKHTEQQKDLSSCGAITAENGKAFLTSYANVQEILNKPYASGAKDLRANHIEEIDLDLFTKAQKDDRVYTASGDKQIEDPSLRADLISIIKMEKNNWVTQIIKHISDSDQDNRDNIQLLKEFIICISNSPNYHETSYIQKTLLRDNNEWQEGAIDLCLSLLEELERKDKKHANIVDSLQNSEFTEVEKIILHNPKYKLDIPKNSKDWSKATIAEKKNKLEELSKNFNLEETSDLDLISYLNTAVDILDNLDTNIPMKEEASKVILIGATGVGKTTISHYLEGNDLVGEEGLLGITLNIKDPKSAESRNIGMEGSSETFYPNLFNIDGLEDHQIVDLAGTEDNNGMFIRIANDFAKKKYFGKLPRAKILFILPFSAAKEKDFSSTIDLFEKSLFKNTEDIDPTKVELSCIIQVPNRLFNRDSAAEFLSKSLLARLEANINNIPENLYKIIENTLKQVALVSEAKEIGDYNIPGQRENLRNFIKETKTTSLDSLFKQETYDFRNFIEKVKNLDINTKLIELFKKKIHSALKNLEIRKLEKVIEYCRKAEDAVEILNRFQQVEFFEDEEFILIAQQQEYYIKTLVKMQKYFLNDEIQEIISKVHNNLQLVLANVHEFIEKLDNIQEINPIIYENTITIKAPYISTKSVRTIMHESEMKKQKIETIKITAGAVDFNCNLNFPSKNLLIKTSSYRINQTVTINLSGLNSSESNTKSDMNSGHFLLDLSKSKAKSDSIPNLIKQLKIITDGGYGQDGKDGKKGETGQDMMHLPGNQPRSGRSLLTNHEQNELLKKLVGNSEEDTKFAHQLMQFIKKDQNKLKGHIVDTSSMSKNKGYDDENNIIMSTFQNQSDQNFLNFSKLPKMLKIIVSISWHVSVRSNQTKEINIDFSADFQKINEEFFNSDYKRSSGFYKNALNEMRENSHKLSKVLLAEFSAEILKILEEATLYKSFSIKVAFPDRLIGSINIQSKKYLIEENVYFPAIKNKIDKNISEQLQTYIKEWVDAEPYFVKAYDDIILSHYKNVALKNELFPRLLDKDALKKDLIFDEKRYPNLNSIEEYSKLENVNKILDVLLRNEEALSGFLSYLQLKKWDEIYQKIVKLWSDTTEKEDSNVIPLCSSLVKVQNRGYYFHKQEILGFSLLNVPAENSNGRKAADILSNTFMIGGVLGAGGGAIAIGVAAFTAAAVATPVVITFAGLGLLMGGAATSQKLDELASFAFEVRSMGVSKICYGNRGENGEDGGNGGDSGESVIVLPQIQDDTSTEKINRGKIGIGGNGGSGGEIGENGIIEYLLVARKYNDITKDDLGDKMIQLGHFYSRLPKNFDSQEYQDHLNKTQSKHGRQGNHGQEKAMPEDLKKEFLDLDLNDALCEFSDNEYIQALMGEDC